jgi:hypothetical protein
MRLLNKMWNWCVGLKLKTSSNPQKIQYQSWKKLINKKIFFDGFILSFINPHKKDIFSLKKIWILGLNSWLVEYLLLIIMRFNCKKKEKFLNSEQFSLSNL